MSEIRKLVESLFDAFQRGDIGFILAAFADDCSLRGTLAQELPYSGHFTGPSGGKQYFDGIFSVL